MQNIHLENNFNLHCPIKSKFKPSTCVQRPKMLLFSIFRFYMTLYFDNRLGDIPGSIEELSFAKNFALVAIRSWSASTEQGVISIYNSDSELIDSEVKVYVCGFLRW